VGSGLFPAAAALAADASGVHRDAQGHYVVAMDSPVGKSLGIDTVALRAVPHGVVLPADVRAEASRQINIFAPVSGRVLSLKVSPGDKVSKGQVLATIASGDMAQALADEAKARSALSLAQEQYRRAQSVFQIGGASSKDLEAARANAEQAQADATRARERLTALSPNNGSEHSSYLTLTAPADGTIATVTASEGQNVTDPTLSLITMVNLEEVWVEGGVPENEMAMASAGVPVDMTFPATGTRVFHGTITSVSPKLDLDTRRVDVRAVMPNGDGVLRPGMFGTMVMMVPQPAQLIVPQSALLMNNDTVTVFREISPGVFERRTVEIGYDESSNTRITAGLSAGDRVVTRGAVLLNDD